MISSIYKNFILLASVSLSMLTFLILALRSMLNKQRNIPTGLFFVALRNENNDYYEQALINYEIALVEVCKTQYQKSLKHKITDKIKVLQTVIEYNSNLFQYRKGAF